MGVSLLCSEAAFCDLPSRRTRRDTQGSATYKALSYYRCHLDFAVMATIEVLWIGDWWADPQVIQVYVTTSLHYITIELEIERVHWGPPALRARVTGFEERRPLNTLQELSDNDWTDGSENADLAPSSDSE